MPNYRVNVNWSTSAPMEGILNDKDLELSKRAQRLRHSRKTITGREVFSVTRKRTVERCDGETNIVVIKAKQAKSVPDIAQIEIDTLD